MGTCGSAASSTSRTACCIHSSQPRVCARRRRRSGIRRDEDINVILFTSAAIPAYLLARRVAGAGLAVAVAALVAFEPWSAYGSLVMTESLFLPAFTTFVLLLARMLELAPAVGSSSCSSRSGLMASVPGYVLVAASSARSGSAAFGHRPSRGRFVPIGSCSSRSGRGSCWRYSLSGRGDVPGGGPATSQDAPGSVRC